MEEFTRELATENRIEVTFRGRPGRLDCLEGEWIHVETSGDRNGAYRIEAAEEGAGDRIVLDVGDATTVREFSDPEDPEEGYRYLLEEGDVATIPLSAAWHR